MAFNTTMGEMETALETLTTNLKKAADGNRAATQRVRTGSILLEKIAKKFRKESVADEKAGGHKKRKAVAKKAKAPAKAKPAKTAKKTKVVAKPKKAVKKPAKKVTKKTSKPKAKRKSKK